MLMNSHVGTASGVLISTCIKLRGNLSIRVKNGILIDALPIRVLCFLGPVIMYAVSGGALTYETARNKHPSITTPKTIKTIKIGFIIHCPP